MLLSTLVACVTSCGFWSCYVPGMYQVPVFLTEMCLHFRGETARIGGNRPHVEGLGSRRGLCRGGTVPFTPSVSSLNALRHDKSRDRASTRNLRTKCTSSRRVFSGCSKFEADVLSHVRPHGRRTNTSKVHGIHSQCARRLPIGLCICSFLQQQ